MPSYIYKAKNSSAQTVHGHIKAAHQEEAVDAITAMGLVPVSVEEETTSGVLVSSIKPKTVRSKDLFLFTKQLASLVKSGIALLKAIEVISLQTQNSYLSKVLIEIANGIKSGRSFSACLEEYPRIFSPVYVSMVRAGEETGNVKDVLAEIAQFQKRQEDLSSKISSAMVYPLLMLGVGLGTVFVILTFVMPKITVIFTQTKEQLPMPTILVMAASQFLKTYWFLIAGITASIVLIFLRFRKTAAGQMAIGYWALRTPFIKDMVLKSDIARFARTMHLLLVSQLPLLRSMEVSAPTIHNPQLKADIYMCAEGLNSGESLRAALQRCVYMPPLFVQVLTIAEESGSLVDALSDMAESCEADLNEYFKGMTTLLEPVMILAIGSVVGFIVFAMLLPIFSMDIMAR